MTNTTNCYRRLPHDSLTAEAFQTEHQICPWRVRAGLLKVILMYRTRQPVVDEGATYRAAVNRGDAMPTYAISIVESNSDRLAVGDIRRVRGDLVELCSLLMRESEKTAQVPQLSNLKIVCLRHPRAKRLHGLISVRATVAGEPCWCRLRPGSVGGYVGQTPRALWGCRVVGIAGWRKNAMGDGKELALTLHRPTAAPGSPSPARACPMG